MKSTGIVRKVDELGRVVIPIELRRTLGIDEKDALEIYQKIGMTSAYEFAAKFYQSLPTPDAVKDLENAY